MSVRLRLAVPLINMMVGPRIPAPRDTGCGTLGCPNPATHRGYDRLMSPAWMCDTDTRGTVPRV